MELRCRSGNHIVKGSLVVGLKRESCGGRMSE